MKRFLLLGAAFLMLLGPGCKRTADTISETNIFATPESTFEVVKKALVNRDADLMWDALSPDMRNLFEEGRKELLAKDIEELKEIAVAGMTSVEELKKLDTEGFFRFYFNYKRREVYRMNSAELVERKVSSVRTATISSVTLQPHDPESATRAYVLYDIAGDMFMLPMVKVGEEWRIDQMDEPQPIPAEGEAVD